MFLKFDACTAQIGDHLCLVIGVVGIIWEQEVELEIILLIRKDPVLKLHSCNSTARDKTYQLLSTPQQS